MLGLRDMSIRRKIALGITLIAGLALLLSALASLIFQARAFRAAKLRQVETLAEVVADNSRAALVFGDADGAGRVLGSLKAIPGLERACVYDASGRVFAVYPESAMGSFPAPRGEGAEFHGEHLELFRAVRQQDEAVGTLYLSVGLEDLRAAFIWHAAFNLGLLGALVLLALGLSFRVQRPLTDPLLDLARLARRVSEEKDYGVRAQAGGRDEIGSLVEAFNEMLEQIQRRDAQLHGYREHLEEEVSRRTEELLRSNQELIVAKDRAEEVSRAKSAFLANMSHELRTPLNAILLYTELLMEQAREEAREAEGHDLERIRGAADHLLRLINDILDLSKVEAGKMSVTLEPVDLRVLVEEIEQTLRPMAAKNGNELRAETPAELPLFLGDTTKLRQALFNLLSNACKFTERGRVELDAELFRKEGAPWLRCVVKDTGIGMSEEQVGRLFQEFTQAEDSISRRYGGTGLGLALSRRLCQLMGGDISVESRPGAGSTFTLTVPAPLPATETQPLRAMGGPDA